MEQLLLDYATLKNANAILEKRIKELVEFNTTFNLALLLIIRASGGIIEVGNQQVGDVVARLGHERVEVVAGEKPNGLIYRIVKV